jgi:hypothetical protein
MPTKELAVISLHPAPDQPLGLDLMQILSALQGRLGRWVWCVRNLDWLGHDGETFCRAVEAAGPGGLWIDSHELIERAQGIYQTIEGEFLAFSKSLDRRTIDARDLSLSSFPAGRAEVAIVAVDGCYFDVYSKDAGVTNSLYERFPDARADDPDGYF